MRREPVDPAARVLDSFLREWALKTNGTWACLGHDLTADSLAEIDCKYGPTEPLG